MATRQPPPMSLDDRWDFMDAYHGSGRVECRECGTVVGLGGTFGEARARWNAHVRGCERLRRDGDVSAQAVWERGPRDD